VLLPVVGVTLLSLRSLLSVHMLVGVALIPPVALKLGSTFYRFFRYYTGSAIFREKGPPQLVMRILIAPALVASTIGLFGSGVALLLLEHPNSLVYTVHKASFIVWIGAIGIHVLAYLRRLPRLALADWMLGDRSGLRPAAASASRRRITARGRRSRLNRPAPRRSLAPLAALAVTPYWRTAAAPLGIRARRVAVVESRTIGGPAGFLIPL